MNAFATLRKSRLFNRSWDNYGDEAFKIKMPSQTSHSVRRDVAVQQ